MIDGSGADIEAISGWISAFCFWDEKGKRIETLDMSEPTLRTAYSERKRLVLDGVQFPLIRPRDIPVGLVSVPVKVQDLISGVEQVATMTAGLVGMTATKKSSSNERNLDCVQPRLGWWILQEATRPLERT
jgi:hypothetical protein